MKAGVLPARVREAPTAVLLYLVGIFLLGFTIDGGIFSVLQNLYLLRLGYGPEFVGIFNSLGLFIFALLSLPIGTIQRWPHRRLLLVGLVLITSGMFAVPLAQWGPPEWQAAWLLVGHVLSYVGLAFFFVHSAPFVLSITMGDWQNRALAWQSATLAVAGFTGGLLGGYLPGWIANGLNLSVTHPTPYQYPLLLAAILISFAFFVFVRMPEPIIEAMNPVDITGESRPSKVVQWVGPIWTFIMLILVVRMLQVATPGAIITFANVYLDDGLHIATDRIGIITAVGKLASVPIALLTPILLSRWGNFKVVIWISLISVVAALPLALTDNWQLAGAGYALASGVGPLRYLSFLVFTLSMVPPERRGLVSGAGEMAIGFGFALMAFVGGYLIEGYGYDLFFGVSLIVTLLGTGLFWLVFGRFRRP